MAAEKLGIGDIARATGTKVVTIRYYEQIGLMRVPARTNGNYRTYSADDLARLSFIRRARDLGFSIEQTREMLSLADQNDRSCEGVDAIAKQHLAEVDRKISDLSALRRELADIIGQCDCGTIADCRIVEALGPPHATGARA
jgi:Cu(I)-responsive transcriptional regulator